MLLHGYEPLSQFDNQMSKEDEFPQDPVEFEQAVLVAFKHQLDKLTKVRKDASENILKAQKTQEKYVNRRIKTTKQSMQPPFQLGEMVLVYQDMIANNTSEKLQDRYAGPYIIHQVYQNSTYTLKTLAGQILPRHNTSMELPLPVPKQSDGNLFGILQYLLSDLPIITDTDQPTVEQELSRLNLLQKYQKQLQKITNRQIKKVARLTHNTIDAITYSEY
ncbi:hypothetical protein EDC96DRAFT_562838 [Choanephora cucurbitarum]|nr:hypothetical protein EDC96DRAFT_562838 [Choanephora cucurbitarum]